MSTNINPLTGEAFVDEFEAESLLTGRLEVEPPDPLDPIDDNNIPSVVPEFPDIGSDDQPVDLYDEYGNVLSFAADSPPELVAIGRTWAFDFEKGDFEMAEGGTPRKLSNDDTRILQQWIRRALTTQQLAYLIYPADFGVDLAPVFSHEVRGATAMAHISNTVKAALLYHDRITGVSDLVVTEEDGTIFVRASIKIDRGEMISVNVPVGGV